VEEKDIDHDRLERSIRLAEKFAELELRLKRLSDATPPDAALEPEREALSKCQAELLADLWAPRLLETRRGSSSPTETRWLTT
jgi:hypothetical protein